MKAFLKSIGVETKDLLHVLSLYNDTQLMCGKKAVSEKRIKTILSGEYTGANKASIEFHRDVNSYLRESYQSSLAGG